jgi:hypothetical protein
MDLETPETGGSRKKLWSLDMDAIRRYLVRNLTAEKKDIIFP